jgi:hypothetical protein
MGGSLRAGTQIGFYHRRVETNIRGEPFRNPSALVKNGYPVTESHYQFDVMFDQKNCGPSFQDAFKQSA